MEQLKQAEIPPIRKVIHLAEVCDLPVVEKHTNYSTSEHVRVATYTLDN